MSRVSFASSHPWTKLFPCIALLARAESAVRVGWTGRIPTFIPSNNLQLPASSRYDGLAASAIASSFAAERRGWSGRGSSRAAPGYLMPVEFIAQAEPIPGYKLIEPLGKGGFGEVWKAEAPGGLLK